MLPWSAEFAGRIDEHGISSELLRGNPFGDPHERPLWVYLPPGYDGEPDRHYPSVYVIQGYSGHLAMWRNRTAYRQPFPETADAMFARGEAPPAIVVYVDAWTKYGGSQFVDSPGTGRYHSYDAAVVAFGLGQAPSGLLAGDGQRHAVLIQHWPHLAPPCATHGADSRAPAKRITAR